MSSPSKAYQYLNELPLIDTGKLQVARHKDHLNPLYRLLDKGYRFDKRFTWRIHLKDGGVLYEVDSYGNLHSPPEYVRTEPGVASLLAFDPVNRNDNGIEYDIADYQIAIVFQRHAMSTAGAKLTSFVLGSKWNTDAGLRYDLVFLSPRTTIMKFRGYDSNNNPYGEEFTFPGAVERVKEFNHDPALFRWASLL